MLLQVIPITVHGPSGYLNTHAMLDNGSTCSLVLAAVADKLGLEGLQERVILNAIQGKSELNSKRVSMHVSPVNLVSPLYEVSRALVVDSLNVPQKKVNLVDLKSKWSHLKDLNIPEASGCEVSMLIGSDCLDIIIPIETRVGPKGTPIGICTKLGWTITGPPPDHARDYEDIYHVHVPSPNEELRDKVKSWWRTEEFGCKYDADSQWSIEDEQAWMRQQQRSMEDMRLVPPLEGQELNSSRQPTCCRASIEITGETVTTGLGIGTVIPENNK